jgi:transmembrane sensor
VIPRADTKVAAEAREWFVRLLDDDVSADEIALWQAWLARSPAHRAAYDRVTDAWTLGGGKAERPTIAELAGDRYDGSASVAEWREKPRRPVLRPALIAASLAVAVLGAAATFNVVAPGGEAQAITTARAEHKAAALADGSRVQVGAMTGVQVRLSDQRREIKLDRGEAFFQVARDESRPFVVKTPFGAVTAAGTAFNVDVGAEQLCITVSEGVVVVRPSGLFARPVRVEAGQRLVADASGVTVAAAPSQVTWTQGRLEYRGEPLRAVIEDVNRYAEHPVVLRDPALGELAYTGTVRLDATGDWAAGLPAAFPLKVAQGEGGVVVLSARM